MTNRGPVLKQSFLIFGIVKNQKPGSFCYNIVLSLIASGELGLASESGPSSRAASLNDFATSAGISLPIHGMTSLPLFRKPLPVGEPSAILRFFYLQDPQIAPEPNCET